jgi:anti-sigma factor RsiW
MPDLEQELLETEEYVCVNSEIGRHLPDFVDGTLAKADQKRFENHLIFCQKCQEEVEYLRLAERMGLGRVDYRALRPVEISA